MDENQDILVTRLGALAQQTRLSVFRSLMSAGPQGISAGKIARDLGVAPNTLSAHLNVLSRSGLVTQRRDGRSIIYSVVLSAVTEMVDGLVNDCCGGHPEACAPLSGVSSQACAG
ncbi:helix-turn-helix transcriptional regulator [Parvularcula sp. ZS-1/3]|uniref:Helix-turn-helix transcriptional regulator n=1 Tax=Parvularcula mediterranea TaxID=2732508 RepID=A0A7Y3W5G7_9PROT|nr:helix-turn-helix transcriptional regulator [Parvularcula mediterranea]NNU16493.1 helix-turn-helix transcriptional regulator [Parvularcula mediterranea]